MARKQLGMVDDELLASVDARAAELGQTRRVFTERALRAALASFGAPNSEAALLAREAEASAARHGSKPRAVTVDLGRGSPSPSLERFAAGKATRGKT